MLSNTLGTHILKNILNVWAFRYFEMEKFYFFMTIFKCQNESVDSTNACSTKKLPWEKKIAFQKNYQSSHIDKIYFEEQVENLLFLAMLMTEPDKLHIHPGKFF